MSASANRRPDGPPGSASRPRTRVLVIVGLFAVAVAASALLGWRFARESTPVTGPIVLISIDPLRADRLSFYGGALSTPHLDRLAAGATVFTRAYAHAAASLPAHASLLTGRLPFEHGVRDDVGFTLGGDAETLASRLADRGFETGAAVSTFLLRPETGLDAGFAHYDAERQTPAGDVPRPAVERDSAATGSAATAWLEAQDSSRFFYALQLNGGAAATDTVPSTTADLAARSSSDATALAAADTAVGSVLDTLRRRGWYDDALVVVTSTYGGPPDGADPGRGFTLAEPVRRVPLVVKMPGASGPQRIDAPMQHIDITPTVLDLVRAPAATNLRGRSFRRLLEGGDEAPPERPAYAEAMSGALRFGWAELAVPDGPEFRSSVAGVRPTVADDAEREALELLGEIVPTLPPLPSTAAPPDPGEMGRVLAAYRRGARLDAERAYSAAAGAYRDVVAGRPDDANAWFRTGLAAARLGRTAEAVDAFGRVEALHPGRGDGAIAAARVEFEAGALDAAGTRLTALLETLAADAPPATRATAHGLLASIAVARARPDDARAHAAQAEEAQPDVPFRAFVEGRILHARNEPEKALAAFDDAVAALDGRRAPFDGLHWLRGDCLARLERPAEAAEAFERALVESPLDPRGYAGLATLLRDTGRKDDARAVAERLVRNVPVPAGYAAAVRLAGALGDRERAAQLRVEASRRFAGEPALRLVR